MLLNDRYAIGGNNPPLDANPIRDRLTEDHADLIKRCADLVAAQGRVPPCTDDTAAKNIGDYIKQLSACIKDSGGRRVKEKEPYLAGGRTVDGFFKDVDEQLGKIKKETNSLLTAYQIAVEAAARKALAEKAAAERKAAEEAAEEAQAALDAMAGEDALIDAVEKEDAALAAADEAARAEKAAAQSAADLSRTRSNAGGSVSSLRTSWAFEGLDRNTIDLESLRAHLPVDGMEKAVRSFIKAGGRTLKGVRIYEEKKAIVK